MPTTSVTFEARWSSSSKKSLCVLFSWSSSTTLVHVAVVAVGRQRAHHSAIVDSAASLVVPRASSTASSGPSSVTSLRAGESVSAEPPQTEGHWKVAYAPASPHGSAGGVVGVAAESPMP